MNLLVNDVDNPFYEEAEYTCFEVEIKTGIKPFFMKTSIPNVLKTVYFSEFLKKIDEGGIMTRMKNEE